MDKSTVLLRSVVTVYHDLIRAILTKVSDNAMAGSDHVNSQNLIDMIGETRIKIEGMLILDLDAEIKEIESNGR